MDCIMSDKEEADSPFLSKQMTFLHSSPGRFNDSEGEPCTLITLASSDTIDPIAISLEDTRRLTVRLLNSLSTAEDEFAEKLLENFPSTDGIYCWPGFENPDAGITSQPWPLDGGKMTKVISPFIPMGRLTARKAMKLKCTIQYGPRYRPRNRAFVVGGYRDDAEIDILYRIMGGFSGVEDSLFRIVGTNEVMLRGVIPADDRLPDNQWDFFLSLPPSAAVQIGKKVKRKMSVEELKASVEGKTFKAIRPNGTH
jgi:hypothetical protein